MTEPVCAARSSRTGAGSRALRYAQASAAPAAVQATTRRRVDLGLRLADPPLGGRLEAPWSMGSGAVTARIGLASAEEVDAEVERWLRRAYDENA